MYVLVNAGSGIDGGGAAGAATGIGSLSGNDAGGNFDGGGGGMLIGVLVVGVDRGG